MVKLKTPSIKYIFIFEVVPQAFGENIDTDKLAPNIYYKINVRSPNSIASSGKVTLHFEIEKLSLEGLSSGEESFIFDETIDISQIPDDPKYVVEATRFISQNYTPPQSWKIKGRFASLQRRVSIEDVKATGLEFMPGFRIRWYYTGNDGNVEMKDYTASFRTSMIQDFIPIDGVKRNVDSVKKDVFTR